jgi:hypothetical protein
MATNFGWEPNSSGSAFTYTVTVAASTYNILVEHADGDWIFCENRMATCCDNTTAGASKTNCP